jgi:hypothetical protein
MPPRLNRFERAMKPKSYTSFSFIFVLSFSAVVVIPLYFWFGLTCTIYTTTWYTVSRCVWCPFWIRPIYHVVHYCTRFSFFFFFFFFTIFYFLSVWVWLLELIRYSESVFFFFRLCASSAELVVEKKPFFTLLWLLLSIPFWPALVSEKGASQSGENGRADDDWTWPVGESSLRIENKKMKSIVLCQFLRRETRRKRPEITLGSLGHRTTHTHRSCRLYILTAGNRRRPES